MTTAASEVDVIIVGAGFAGLSMLHRLRSQGLSTRLFEAGDNVGGTWFWNRYPGARCDVESHEYSYSFSPELDQEWRWTERYATQDEILRYLNHVADRFDLRSRIQFGTRVKALHYDQVHKRWQVHTSDNKTHESRFCVMATGCLSLPNEPQFAGLERYTGIRLQTARWPLKAVDFEGLSVGVIGTGSTGIQAIPKIAESAHHLYVFQRTAHFCLPARNRPITDAEDRGVKDRYPDLRAALPHTLLGFTVRGNPVSALSVTPAEREREYQARWDAGGTGFMGAFNDLLFNEKANATAADFIRARIRETVKDPEVAARLCPTGYPLGTKRPCLGTNYYETFNRSNVTLVDVKRDPIVEFTAAGIRTTSAEYALDAVVFATGFDAITGPLLNIDIRGRAGQRLADKWTHGPIAYLGLGIHGFPNLFMITGPGSPSVLSNMVVSIEQHVELIADCILELRQRGKDSVEPTAEAESQWALHVDEVARSTLYYRGDSWYLGANVPGKPRLFMPYCAGVGTYRAECETIKAAGWRGYVMS
jgi:cyclohexanone monooxygenase